MIVVRARWSRLFLSACAVAALSVTAACTSNSSFPSPSISTALTPQEEDLASAKKSGDEQSAKPAAEGSTAKAESEKKDAAAETKLALAPSQKPSAPEAAASSLAKADTKSTAPTPAPERKSSDTSDTEEKAETAAVADEPKEDKPKARSGFFANLFKPSARRPKADIGDDEGSTSRGPAPKVRLTARKRATVRTAERGEISGLPGVKRTNIFDIDEEETEEFDEPIRTASIANLATRGRHGLLLQRPDVKVGCFPRSLLGILKRVERRFKRTPIVTSGYRSPRYNRMVRGARKSTHIRCMAADIQVKGVSKWQLAKFLRTLPGRGGVGTYCHTKSVHIDVGKKRAWHHCRRSRKKRRKA